MRALLRPLGVECVDAFQIRRQFPARMLKGWELKAYAIQHSDFREVLLLDADNVPVVNPEFLFDLPQYQAHGAVFWPDYGYARNEKVKIIWRSLGIRRPREREFETGQILVDKQRCWEALRLAMWFNENSDFYYKYVHGDKETFHMAFRKLKKSYALVDKPIHSLQGIMCQHDFDGRRIFQHRNSHKWTLHGPNRQIEGFWHEAECLDYLQKLRSLWSGGRLETMDKAHKKKREAMVPNGFLVEQPATTLGLPRRGFAG